MKTKQKPAKKETYWLPTARSPWAVIFYLRSRKRWDFFNAYYHRETARSMASHMKIRPDVLKARVVRAWIPLQ